MGASVGLAWGGRGQRSAILVGGRDGALAPHALSAAGCRLIASLGFEDAARELAWRPAPDLLVIDAEGQGSAPLEQALGWAPDLAAEHGTALIVATSLDQLDSLGGRLLDLDAQLLCEPDSGDWARALVAPERPRGRLNDPARAHRHAMVDEVSARVGVLAAELRRLADRHADHAPLRRAPDKAVVAEIRRALLSRRLRAQYFSEALFADPAWDMLLDLYVAHLEGRRVTVSSVCIAAAVPKTTALRWIKNLETVALFERIPDATDRRRAYIMLSEAAVAAMDVYVASARRAGLPIA